ncbi:MAG: NADH:flavin oxidoreductase [Gammaproteobacteria bacterium]|nr:NADH:flavin oxidoreductase [Gammaproteobacteria bacterium]
MSIKFKTLFETFYIKNLKISNRLVVAPMTRVSANADGSAGPLMKEYYQEFAKGGFGLMITEGLYTDQHYSQGYRNQPGIATTDQAETWREIIEGVHKNGAFIIAQLMHAGALSQYNSFANKTIGPSAVSPIGAQMSLYEGEGLYPTPAAMNEKDIARAISGFVNAAKHAKEVGFDGVEIHGANGYLLDQFLTSYTNTRDDSYGGSLTNRVRIYQEIIEAVRDAVGEQFIVGIRFSQKKVNDTEYVWEGGESAAEYIFSLVHECHADYIHTTEPMINKPAFKESVSLAALAKKYSCLPVIANGGVNDPDLAQIMISSGQADMIALGKMALANQDYPNLIKLGKPIKPFSFEMLTPRANLKCAKNYFASNQSR